MTDHVLGKGGASPVVGTDQSESRRGFFRQVAAGAVAAMGTHAASEGLHAADTGADPAKLSTVKIGKHSVTRLVAGANPVSGYSHSSQTLSRHMREFFTLERTIEFVQRIEKAGINTWQTNCSDKIHTTLRKVREQGSKIQWVCLTADRAVEPSLDEIVALKPIAIVHHGGVTDTMFRLNKHDKVHDFVKKVQDAGVMAGVSSHNPQNIAYVEEKGWENELFMTCFYNVLRPGKDIRAKLGTIPLGEPFFESDPAAMAEVVRQVKRPCLAFKILAAGRLAGTKHAVEGAFRFAYENIKKTDAVIVGMYPKFSDEIAHDAQLAQKYGMLA